MSFVNKNTGKRLIKNSKKQNSIQNEEIILKTKTPHHTNKLNENFKGDHSLEDGDDYEEKFEKNLKKIDSFIHEHLKEQDNTRIWNLRNKLNVELEKKSSVNNNNVQSDEDNVLISDDADSVDLGAMDEERVVEVEIESQPEIEIKIRKEPKLKRNTITHTVYSTSSSEEDYETTQKRSRLASDRRNKETLNPSVSRFENKPLQIPPKKRTWENSEELDQIPNSNETKTVQKSRTKENINNRATKRRKLIIYGSSSDHDSEFVVESQKKEVPVPSFPSDDEFENKNVTQDKETQHKNRKVVGQTQEPSKTKNKTKKLKKRKKYEELLSEEDSEDYDYGESMMNSLSTNVEPKTQKKKEKTPPATIDVKKTKNRNHKSRFLKDSSEEDSDYVPTQQEELDEEEEEDNVEQIQLKSTKRRSTPQRQMKFSDSESESDGELEYLQENSEEEVMEEEVHLIRTRRKRNTPRKLQNLQYQSDSESELSYEKENSEEDVTKQQTPKTNTRKRPISPKESKHSPHESDSDDKLDPVQEHFEEDKGVQQNQKKQTPHNDLELVKESNYDSKSDKRPDYVDEEEDTRIMSHLETEVSPERVLDHIDDEEETDAVPNLEEKSVENDSQNSTQPPLIKKIIVSENSVDFLQLIDKTTRKPTPKSNRKSPHQITTLSEHNYKKTIPDYELHAKSPTTDSDNTRKKKKHRRKSYLDVSEDDSEDDDFVVK